MKHTIFIENLKKNMRAKRPTFKYKGSKGYGCYILKYS